MTQLDGMHAHILHMHAVNMTINITVNMTINITADTKRIIMNTGLHTLAFSTGSMQAMCKCQFKSYLMNRRLAS